MHGPLGIPGIQERLGRTGDLMKPFVADEETRELR
jgi:hypothetical protein